MFMIVSLIVIALAGGCMLYLFLEGSAAQRILSAWSDAKLAELGIAVEGDSLKDYRLHGSVHGAEVEVHAMVERAPPGAREDEPKKTVCVIKLALPLPDLIVCRSTDVDRVMGPLPAVPRTRTGHADFDKVYSLFVSSGATGDQGGAEGGYRRPGTIGPLGWAKPPILDRLTDLGLVWMRAREGACELAFEIFVPEDTVRAVVTSANMLRALTGAALIPVPAGEPVPKRDAAGPRNLALFGPVAGGLWAIILAMPLSVGLDLSMTETVLCVIGGVSLICCAIGASKLRELKRGPPWSTPAPGAGNARV